MADNKGNSTGRFFFDPSRTETTWNKKFAGALILVVCHISLQNLSPHMMLRNNYFKNENLPIDSAH